MTANLRMAQWHARSIDALTSNNYHGLLGTLGYEERSSTIPLALASATRRLAPAFISQQEASFPKNQALLQAAGFDTPVDDDRQFVADVDTFVTASLEAADIDVCRLAIDISSMSRFRIATVVEALASLPVGTRMVADVLYAPAAFRTGAAARMESSILRVGPVSSFFAGWWDDLDLPLAVVMGVGYELEHASSAIDRLEPEDTYVFVPEGEDPQYLPHVHEANAALYNTRGVHAPVTYLVIEPFACFQRLESEISRLRRDHRVAVVALGPKIFAACAAFACTLHDGAAQLIRVSAHARGDAVDRAADGTVCGLRAIIGGIDAAALHAVEQDIPSVHIPDTGGKPRA